MLFAALYHGLVGFLWLVLRVFFRTVEVVGREHVPAKGPVLFVGNHPNSLIDPVLIITSCGRKVSFAAKDTLFSSPLLRIFLAILGAVPVRRRQDLAEGEGPVDNTAAFEALFDVLRRGGAFGIVPEGISHSRAELAPLKTGAARIALGAKAEGLDVQIVPCGLTYKRRERLRSRALVQFGVPLTISDEALAAWQDDPREAARALTADIELALRALTINAKDFETLRVLDGVRRLFSPPERKLSLAERAELIRRFIDPWERLKGDPKIAAFYDEVSLSLFGLESLGLKDRDLLRPVSRRAWALRLVRHVFFLVVLVPFALPGLVF